MILTPPYQLIDQMDRLPSEFSMADHLGGFDLDLKNDLFTRLDDYARNNDRTFIINVDQFYPKKIHDHYKNLQIKFDYDLFFTYRNLPNNTLVDYKLHPKLQYKNFLCSFNGSPHVSRKLLVAILDRFGLFNPSYSTKNFSFSVDQLDGHIKDYTNNDQNAYYRKFFIGDQSDNFFEKIYTINYNRTNHLNNISILEESITKSFLHIVSETIATSYYPFVTEKFFYSIVTRGLFLTFGQPGWYSYIEHYFGFRKYLNIFDYRFDEIQNPIERLIELISMILKFSKFTPYEWHDLSIMERDNIEFNYDNYFSGDYLKKVKEYCE